MEGSCECCNEPPGSIPCGNFLDQLRTVRYSKWNLPFISPASRPQSRVPNCMFQITASHSGRPQYLNTNPQCRSAICHFPINAGSPQQCRSICYTDETICTHGQLPQQSLAPGRSLGTVKRIKPFYKQWNINYCRNRQLCLWLITCGRHKSVGQKQS